jgi:hypothetical protein
VDRNSAVGIATHYELDRPGIESQWGARFSTTVQTGSSPSAQHPIQCVPGLSFLEGKAAEAWH